MPELELLPILTGLKLSIGTITRKGQCTRRRVGLVASGNDKSFIISSSQTHLDTSINN